MTGAACWFRFVPVSDFMRYCDDNRTSYRVVSCDFRNLGMVAAENNASSCVGSTVADRDGAKTGGAQAGRRGHTATKSRGG